MKRFSIPTIALITALGLTAGCDVDVTEEGQMPTMDVDVDPGTMPEMDVETADVDVSMEEKTVTVPDVDITGPDED